jgi:hypothetical protein
LEDEIRGELATEAANPQGQGFLPDWHRKIAAGFLWQPIGISTHINIVVNRFAL